MIRVLMILCGALAASTARAEDWTGQFTIYGWVPAANTSTTIDRPGGSISADGFASMSDILEALKFAAFAHAEAQRGKFGLTADLIYTDLGVDGSTGIGLESETDLKMLMVTAAATWRVWDNGRGYVDALAGGRVVSADVDLALTDGVSSASASKSTSWVDPLVGARVGYAATDQLSLKAMANIGGFGVGSELTWEAFAGASYAFTDTLSGEVGYRFLSIDYESGDLDLDTQLYGPAVGVTVKF